MKWLTSLTLLLAVCGLPAKENPADSLLGRVVTGYQGWFSCPGDGSQLQGWFHWGFAGDFGAADAKSRCTVDLWPDVSELGAQERFRSPLGADVFSSHHPKTVQRHFAWMKEYGIDSAFVQRFGAVLRDARHRAFTDQVLQHCQAAAEQFARGFCVMYDLSGLRSGEIAKVVMPDWRRLKAEMKITTSPSYQHHEGRPVVGVWGVGFNDGRAYTLAECEELVEFLKADGCRVFLGVPFWWRQQKNDAVADPALERIAAKADFLSPWAVGRFRTPEEAEAMLSAQISGDRAWCRKSKIGHAPVVFPGFTWRNLEKTRGRTAALDAIPRRKGAFFWSQVRAAVGAGARTLYVAMFDEVDEGTAIFKCTNSPPTAPDGSRMFADFEGLPPDFYLWLAGQAGRAVRGEIPLEMPRRSP
ncbi:MAG: xylosidase/arabinosidase [Verrucomicrobiales bacterium]|nr:xylosidase/arabinosidase [Verrucomicrobiales bacterium]